MITKNTSAALAAVLSLGGIAFGQDVVLSDGGVTAVFNETDAGGFFQTDWVVGGVDQLFEQSFLLSLGGGLPDFIDSNAPVFELVTDTDFDGDPDTFTVAYEIGGLDVQVQYALTGSGQASQLSEVITISNLTDEAISGVFWQYADFDLNGTPFDAEVSLSDDNVIVQSDEDVVAIEEFGGAIATPAPTFTQFGDPGDVQAALIAGDLDGSTSAANSDLAWALGWGFTVAAAGEQDSTFVISKIKSVVPTPGALGVAALAGLAAARRRR